MLKKFSVGMSGKTWLAVLMLLAAVIVLAACGGADETAKKDEQKQDEQKSNEQKPDDNKQAEQEPVKPIVLPDLVAEYKGGKVEKAEFMTFMNIMRFLNPDYQEVEKQPEFMTQMLEAYVSYRVVAQKVDKKLLKDMSKDVEQQIADIEKGMSQSFGENGFNNRLKEFSLSKADLTSYLNDRYHMMQYVTSRVTDAEVKKEYDTAAKKGEMKQTVATVSHILIGTNEGQPNARTKEEALKKAKEVLAELKAGADFAAAAKKYSDDPGSKDNGGTYADANVDDWVPEFREAAITLKLNTLSEPVETQFGYHLMKVSKRSEKVKTFAETENELRNKLSQDEFISIMENEIKPMITKNNVK